MAITSGFYNSLNGDRKYTAEQMSAFFDGLITDGVFSSIGEKLKTIPGEGMSVLVQSGRAWFSHTWVLNDSNYSLKIDAADPTLKRKDAIIIEIDHSTSGRIATFKVVRGTPSQDPQKPTVSSTSTLTRVPIAYVTIQNGSSAISGSDIEINVGRDQTCPYVAGVVQQVSAADIYSSWEREFHEDLTGWETEFTEWFGDIQSQLAGDVATNLLNQINEIKRDYLPKADKATSADMAAGTNDSKYVTAKALTEGGRSASTGAIKPLFEGPDDLYLLELSSINIPVSPYDTTGLFDDHKPITYKLYSNTYNNKNEEHVHKDEIVNGAFLNPDQLTSAVSTVNEFLNSPDLDRTNKYVMNIMDNFNDRALSFTFNVKQRITSMANEAGSIDIKCYEKNSIDPIIDITLTSSEPTCSIYGANASTMADDIAHDLDQHILVVGMQRGEHSDSYNHVHNFFGVNLLKRIFNTDLLYTDMFIYDFNYNNYYLITKEQIQAIKETLFENIIEGRPGYYQGLSTTSYYMQPMFVTKKYIGWILWIGNNDYNYSTQNKMVCVYFARTTSKHSVNLNIIGNDKIASHAPNIWHAYNGIPSGSITNGSYTWRERRGDNVVIIGNKVGILHQIQFNDTSDRYPWRIAEASMTSSAGYKSSMKVINDDAVWFDLDSSTIKYFDSGNSTTLSVSGYDNSTMIAVYLGHDDRYLYYLITTPDNMKATNGGSQNLLRIDTVDFSMSQTSYELHYDTSEPDNSYPNYTTQWPAIIYVDNKYMYMYGGIDNVISKYDKSTLKLIERYKNYRIASVVSIYKSESLVINNPNLYWRPIDTVDFSDGKRKNLLLEKTPLIYFSNSYLECLYDPMTDSYDIYSPHNNLTGRIGRFSSGSTISESITNINVISTKNRFGLTHPYANPICNSTLYVTLSDVSNDVNRSVSGVNYSRYTSQYRFYRKEPLEIK